MIDDVVQSLVSRNDFSSYIKTVILLFKLTDRLISDTSEFTFSSVQLCARTTLRHVN